MREENSSILTKEKQIHEYVEEREPVAGHLEIPPTDTEFIGNPQGIVKCNNDDDRVPKLSRQTLRENYVSITPEGGVDFSDSLLEGFG